MGILVYRDCDVRRVSRASFVQLHRIGWLLHTGWDMLHHLYGNPIVPFAATSSLGCAICDPVIAMWCFMGAPSIWERLRGAAPSAYAK